MDHLDAVAAAAFPGYLVRKDLVRRYARQYPVPTYVVEFLLGRYCASVDEKEIEEGLADRREAAPGAHRPHGRGGALQGPGPRRGLGQAHRHRAGAARREERLLRRRAAEPRPATTSRSPTSSCEANERMLTDGFYAEVTLEYDPRDRPGEAAAGRSASPRCGRSRCRSRTCSTCSREGGRAFTTEEWRDFLIRSIGLEPSALDERAKRVVLLRMVPFVERNYNLVELGPARHRQEPPLPADLALLAPDLGRQGHRRQDVRQQGERPAWPGLPVRRGLLRRGVGRSPSTRRTASTS